MNVVIFRENTEDVYAGIEWAQGTPEAEKVIEFLTERDGEAHPARLRHRHQADLGVGTKRLVRMAIQYAIDNKRKTVTLVHKGNIMKFTEGAFRDWGYELAKAEFRDHIVTEDEVAGRARSRDGKVAHQRPDRRQRVPADPDAPGGVRRVRDAEPERRLPVRRAAPRRSAASGIAPGANIGDDIGFFEATHGTAPKYAGKDKINPGSVILSGVMMFRYLGWGEAAT